MEENTISLDIRHNYIFSRVKDFFISEDTSDQDNISSIVDRAISDDPSILSRVHALLEGAGTTKLLFYIDHTDSKVMHENQGLETSGLAGTRPKLSDERENTSDTTHTFSSPTFLGGVYPSGSTSRLCILDPKTDPMVTFRSAIVYLIRSETEDPISSKDLAAVVQSLSMGILNADPLEYFSQTMLEVYTSILGKQQDWGSNSSNEQKDFLVHLMTFSEEVNEMRSMKKQSCTLTKVSDSLVSQMRAAAMRARVNRDPKIASMLSSTVEGWIDVISGVLSEVPNYNTELNDEMVGPRNEIIIWKRHWAKLQLIDMQIRDLDTPGVLQYLRECKSTLPQQWISEETNLSEALSEARENVKYLSSLDSLFTDLYVGTPQSIQQLLPMLLHNIRMMYLIARHYGTRPRMTALLYKITNQIILTCKTTLNPSGVRSRIWEMTNNQETLQEFLKQLHSITNLNRTYREEYRASKEILAQKDGKQFDFDELKFIGHFNLFTKRVDKLIVVFTKVQQFMMLKSYHVEQIEDIISRFEECLAKLRGNTTDILDIHDNNKFDFAFKSFEHNMNELETSLQVAINSAFESITSTENALALLKRLKFILRTEEFQTDLASKYLIIFQSYGLELENDQNTYERFKANPPLVRNATPVAGAVMWSRQLLHHVQAPMEYFKDNQMVMNNPKESKKIVRMYNKISLSLMEYEAIWVDAWKRSIDYSKSGLNATLLVRHNGRLFVNFDKELFQLIKETRVMMQLGDIEIPEPAVIVLLQEQKLKSFYEELTYLTKQYIELVGLPEDPKFPGRIISIVRFMLQPNLTALDDVILPGELTITWNSMNIDVYLINFRKALDNFEGLITKVNGIIQYRIKENLELISSTVLINLFSEECSLDQFLSQHEKHIRQQSAIMDVKNKEIETASDDVIHTILESQGRTKDSHSNGDLAKKGNMNPVFDPENANIVLSLKAHFNSLMFKSILTSTIRSLNLLRKRVGTRNRVALMFSSMPFLHADIELTNTKPFVVLNPTLDEIQRVINRCATAILSCSELIGAWKTIHGEFPLFFDEMTRNQDVVRVVLLLTGSVNGMTHQLTDFLKGFSFEYLWKQDKEEEYNNFVARHPTLDDYATELNRFTQLEEEIINIPSKHIIGCLGLSLDPLKQELKRKAQEWKEMYSRNLEAKAQRELDEISKEISDFEQQFSQPLPDQEKLEDLRVMIESLSEVRTLETVMPFRFEPLMQQYNLLKKYHIPVSQEEIDRVSELPVKWHRLRKVTEKKMNEINQIQPGFKKGLLIEVQKFGIEAITFRNDFEVNGPMVDGISPQEAMERLRRYRRQFDDKFRKWMTNLAGEELFGLPVHLYPELTKTKRELELLEKLYSLYINVLQKVKGYNDVLWQDLNFDQIAEEVNGFMSQCKRFPKLLREWDAYKVLRKILDDFIELQPVVQELKSPWVSERHWQDIMKISGHTWKTDPDLFKLQDLVDANLLNVREEVMDIASSSAREAEIEVKFRTQEALWKDLELHFSEFKHRGPIILKGDDTTELREGLEESAMAINSLLASRYCSFMRPSIQTFLQRLVKVGETLTLWVEVQFAWMYLESVFAGGDIMRQLPQEAKRFAIIDKSWYKIMNKANETPNVFDFCYENELLENLPHLKDQLDECQRKLSLYLEQKRNLFPRFYFVSDTVLLEILSQASDPQSIQPHLSSIFDGIADVKFERVRPKEVGQTTYLQIVEMISGEGEQLGLNEPIPCVGPVEDWLNRLCAGMCNTVQEVVKGAVTELTQLLANISYLNTLIEQYPAQVTLLMLQLMWTSDVTDTIMRGAMRSRGKESMAARAKCDAVKNFLVGLTCSPALEKKTKRTRTNVETLITIQVHQQEVFMELQKANIRDITNFDWLKQSRFYYRPELDTAIISIADSDTEYCNEYLGVKERLVITPLTDRCYITLSQALAMYMGGAPAGPAGTGKTETTKDLARTYGKFCVVFNCSDQLDRNAMGKIIRGLSQANAWGCFDEFNRIDLPVLSVVAQQVSCVLQALKQHKEKFIFIDGQVTDLRPGVGFFITMNPGYAGRQELPENLKILFRGVTMMVPDRQTIMKVKLASQGYTHDEVLSKKFFTLYHLCEEQLSKQRHYDFGLRNILSVLRTAGAVLRRNQGKDEEDLFMRTLRDMNLSKLVFEDIELFDSLLRDMFPGRQFVKGSHPEIEGVLNNVIKEKGLITWTPWINKIIQLYETKLVRHGIMVVGPALCGKSQCYHCMTETLSKVSVPHRELRMNPKAVTAPQMFGRMDVTGDWHDGVFSSLWRHAVRSSKKQNIWIVCDGPVDAIWIENLNTVLDDNRLLTLANGDRIQMTDSMKCCFEIENLANASPATVSRAGIIFISDVILGWRPILEAQLKAKMNNDGVVTPDNVVMCCSAALSQKLLRLVFSPIDASDATESSDPAQISGGSAESGSNVGIPSDENTIVGKIFDFYSKHCNVVMQTSLSHIMTSVFHLVTALGHETGDSADILTDALVEKIFWFSLAWAFGGLLESRDREKMDQFIRQYFTSLPPVNEGLIFDFSLNCKTGKWVPWSTFLTPWKYPGDDRLDFSTLFIPTTDSIRILQLMKYNSIQRRPTMLIGVSGAAKTATLERFLNQLKENDPTTDYRKINFSSMTSPKNFYNTLDDMLEKKIGATYGPKTSKLLTIFIDDLNMQEINEWGDQITNELVRQVIESRMLYDLSRPGLRRDLTGVAFMAAMSHPSGGKNDIPNRLKRHFSVLNMPLPDEGEIQQIFGSIFEGRFSRQFSAGVQDVAKMLTGVSIQFWKAIRRRMLPTPDKFHYFFNIRDLSQITQGVMMAGMHFDPDCPEKRRDSKPWEFITDPVTLLRLWKHECYRVFGDRLNSVNDKKWFDANLQECLEQYLGPTPYSACASEVVEPSYFVNFLHDPTVDPETGEIIEAAPRIYELAPDLEVIRDRLTQNMELHNESPAGRAKKLDLVLFDSAIKHVVRISRVLSLPRGNLLLVGVGGNGKQSLTRLASFVNGYDFQTLTVSKNFGVNQLFDAIREQYISAAFRKPITMLFTDSDIKQENFLEYINSFLSNGEIAGLFVSDQRDSIINETRGVIKRDPYAKFEDLNDVIWRYFINRVRERLHFVLCFSPSGEGLRTRARKFPALVSCCIIDWFFPWPQQALHQVSTSIFDTIELAAEPEAKQGLITLMTSIHQMMLQKSEEYLSRYRRSVHSTPKSYLHYLGSFVSTYQEKFIELNENEKKIGNGLQKLQQAGEDVRLMQIQLQEKEVLLSNKRRETDLLVEEIEVRSSEAEKKRADVEIVKEAVARDAAIVAEGEIEAKRDLQAAEPTLLEAIESLNSITAGDFVTLKKLANPPALIKRIFDGVQIFLHRPLTIPGTEIVKGNMWITDSWNESGKAFASEAGTLALLRHFGQEKKDQINEETCELLLPYLRMEDFTREKAKNACGNVAGLCTWVRSMYKYVQIAKIVAPKKEALRMATIKLRAANKKKEKQEQELARVSAEVAKYNAQYEEENTKKLALEMDAANTKQRMNSANSLIEALSGERERWTQQCAEFRSLIQRLIGDVALSCAFISYCGPFNAEFRQKLLYESFYPKCKQLKLPVTQDLNIVKFLVDETTIADWQMEGLPVDDHSVQNAIMIRKSEKFPLIIDPQGQALAWIRHRTEEKGSKVCRLGDKSFFLNLQEQLSNGAPLIIENVPEEIDPILDPILEKQIFRTGGDYIIRIDGQDLSYDPNFSMYMTTKLPNPSFSPEIFARCLVIDFTVTMEGLEQQLLSHVIGREKTELNETSARLTEEINQNEKRRRDLEDRLLKHLSESTGNLIDDVLLIRTLQETKDATAVIQEQLMSTMETKRNIATACEEYRPVATRGAVLYFLVVELSLVNNMYQTSLAQFIELFDLSILRSKRHPVVLRRVSAIVDYLTFFLFTYIIRGIFSKHKLLFVLLMACKIQIKAHHLDPVEFEALLKGGGGAIQSDRAKPFPWMKEKAWTGILAIAEQVPKPFSQLPDLIIRNESAWRHFIDSEAPESIVIPELQDRLGFFERLLLIRALREDRTMLAAGNYVSATLGKEYMEPQQLDLTQVVEETDGLSPIVFSLSQGSDPTVLIESTAKKMKQKVFPISMGQGQEDAAMAIVLNCWQNGGWALLQNCHLGLPFTVQLEERIRGQAQNRSTQGEKTVETHPDCRIWITAEPHIQFPIGLLQMSVKLTNEPPQGIRASMIRCYSWMSQDYVDMFRRPEWRPMLFAQCFLHSMVVERRKFGPIGFCVPYEFNQGDWTASVQFLINHMTTIGENLRNSVSRDTVCYMVAEIQYGGRITDNVDRLLFRALTEYCYDLRITNPNNLPGGNPSGSPIGAGGLPSGLGQSLTGKDSSIAAISSMPASAGLNAPRVNDNRFLEPFSGYEKHYQFPSFDDIRPQMDFIRETYPDVDTPEVFRMHLNADITYRTRQAQEVLATIIDIQPRQATQSGNMTREEKVLQMMDGYMKILPVGLKVDYSLHLSNRQPLTIFARQEIQRLSRTISVVRDACKNVKLAVAGTIILTPDLQSILNYLNDARVPPSWLAVGWPSSSISLWIHELMRRYEQLNQWATTGRPALYWLPGFFNPQGFLTSVRQEITRSHAEEAVPWALDKVETRTEVRGSEYRPGVEAKAEDLRVETGEVLIYGLYLEGAMWDKINKRLKDPPPGDLFRELPLLLISAVNTSIPVAPTAAVKSIFREKVKKQEYYKCPVYKYPQRTDIHWIFNVMLPVAEDDAYWRMRGVALLGSID